MSLFPDKSSDQRKEDFLQRSPLLRAFLDTTTLELNPEQWAGNIKEYGNKVHENMAAHLGNDWLTLTLWPFFINAEILSVLNPEMTVDQKFTTIGTIPAVGFEIESHAGVHLVLEDIFRFLRRNRFFNPLCLNNEPGVQKAVDFVSTLLATGVYLKNLPPKDNRGDKPTQPANPFDDFINGLDLANL